MMRLLIHYTISEPHMKMGKKNTNTETWSVNRHMTEARLRNL